METSDVNRLTCQESCMLAPPAMAAAGSQFEELFAGVDDLIRRVADTENPEIRKTRARVHAALVAAKSAFEAGTEPVPRRAVQDADTTDDYLRDNSEETLGLALLVVLGLGLMASSRQ
jgi:ElaB/YqjD/DUF883 family membrane-anchored ribosome-binding protein